MSFCVHYFLLALSKVNNLDEATFNTNGNTIDNNIDNSID